MAEETNTYDVLLKEYEETDSENERFKIKSTVQELLIKTVRKSRGLDLEDEVYIPTEVYVDALDVLYCASTGLDHTLAEIESRKPTRKNTGH